MSMNDKVDTKPTLYSCEFCNNKFKRSSTLDSHLCEHKRRWQLRDKVGNRLGYGAWRQFFSTTNRKKLSVEDFIRNTYYNSFIKFGNYLHDIRAVAVEKYIDWLIKHSVALHEWTSDAVYTRYLIEHMREESLSDAIVRSVSHCEILAERYHVRSSDVFRYVPENVIIQSVTTGRISPWLLYQSISGHDFLSRLNELQENLLTQYLDPDSWELKFKSDTESVAQAKHILQELGW